MASEKPDKRRGARGADAEPNLDAHPLVRQLAGEGDEPPPPVVTLIGYVGPSKRPDSVRLYADLGFRTYYEIPRAGIRANQPGADENSPTRLSVDAATRIEIVQTTRQSVEASYLTGAISGGFLGGAAAARSPICLTVVTANPTDCGPVCLTVVTANPTDCGPICLTVVTANPTDCGPRGGLAQAAGAARAVAAQPVCITLHTAYPTWCQPACLTVVTANPTDCGPVCLTVVTANPTDCGPKAVGAARGAAAQPLCITLHTAVPTNCSTPCITLHTANPTWCQPCITLHTAVPTNCG